MKRKNEPKQSHPSMRVYREAKFVTCMRTEAVEIREEQLKELRRYKACPYKGETPQEFLAYLCDLDDVLQEPEYYNSAPKLAQVLVDRLYYNKRGFPFHPVRAEKNKNAKALIVVGDADTSKLLVKEWNGCARIETPEWRSR